MQIRERVSLKNYNTLGFGAQARFFFYADSLESLREALAYADQNKLPILLLGGGSNIVLTQNFDGLVVYVGLQGKNLQPSEAGRLLHAGAGENWHQLVTWSLQNQAYGLENLSLIPGNIGAAPIQNIGAYGVELKDVFHQLTALHIHTGELVSFDPDDCGFAYRDSVFKGKYRDQFVITEVVLALSEQEELNISYGALQSLLDQKSQPLSAQLVSDVVCEVRQSKLPDPAVIGNAGSFFKNPVVSLEQAECLKAQNADMPLYRLCEDKAKLAAGWLIEQAGFKGCVRSGVGVHDKQALVLVNRGQGTGAQLMELAQEIQAEVKARFSVSLEIEPRVY